MIAGVATDTMVESTRNMKKPRQSENSAGQGTFTPVAGYMLANYEGVFKLDGEVGNKKQYDPRAWGKEAEAGMAARIVEACEHLRSAGTHA